MKVLAVFGTRPEAIKMCPLVLQLNQNTNIECKVCLTGQHREMLKQVMEAFEVAADYNLDIMTEKQTLTSISSLILDRLEAVLDIEKPDIVLVHGDTSTAFVAALASFYKQIPVGHVEAGLRTGDKYSPFPEEMNRSLTARIATLHFAPTILNRDNLEREGITQGVYVTGNTVIDAFKTTIQDHYQFHEIQINEIDITNKKIILVTAHRRENLGENLSNICHAIRQLAIDNSDVIFVYPVHPNPIIMETVNKILAKQSNIYLTKPLDVIDMHNLISRCYLVMTDSGGLQEEAPACGKPVLVMRTETERPEAVEAGTVRVVGVNPIEIYQNAMELLSNEESYSKMTKATNPYGDGKASERICSIIEAWMNFDKC